MGNVVAIIQARMGSTRLPGKVLADVGGKPMLWHVVKRLERAKELDRVAVATSTAPEDGPIADFCIEHEIDLFRGDKDDVLDRYFRAAEHFKADVVVRITADCPLIDAGVVDKIVAAYRNGEYDYVSNVLRCTYPDGLDAEVFSIDSIKKSWLEASKFSDREHVNAYILGSGEFRKLNVVHDVDLSVQQLRWTVDGPDDLVFIRAVYASFCDRDHFSFQDLLDLLAKDEELQQIQPKQISNAGYYKTLYEHAQAGAAPRRDVSRSMDLFDRAKKIIPGCAQTFSKGYTQHIPGVSPLYLAKGKGSGVWDVDGNEYIDYIQGLLPNILGYAHDEVNRAVMDQVAMGHSFSQPHPVEVELAERLVRLIPCAEMVRFGKNGSDATSGAIRAARGYTGRDRVACCGYHGWHDWYIGSTTRSLGVPDSVADLTHNFPYNDLQALERLLAEHPGEYAAVIMEPVNFIEPHEGYLSGVAELASAHGILLIFDEICSGFHFELGGAQKLYGVEPDLACFGKAMGNGFPISCIVGRADIMSIFEDIFYSFTFGGEVASMAASLKVLDILEQTDALANMREYGSRIQDGLNTMVKEAGLQDRLVCDGRPSWSRVNFLDGEGEHDFLFYSLFLQETVKRGILMLSTHNMSAAHGVESTEKTLEVYAEVVKTLADWLSDEDPSLHLEGKVVQPVFRSR
jgi:glutamate-1-semialdehyde aminotransferase/spore coat polysaccharide biosynthesis protein SpsF (cytidylyltransferase family)